jgi:hypothetical protein
MLFRDKKNAIIVVKYLNSFQNLLRPNQSLKLTRTAPVLCSARQLKTGNRAAAVKLERFSCVQLSSGR